MYKRVIVRCSCLSVDHVVALDVFDDSAYLHVTRSPYLGLWGRIKSAWRYVFRSEPGTPYDVVCLSFEDAVQLQVALQEYVVEPLRKYRGRELEEKGKKHT